MKRVKIREVTGQDILAGKSDGLRDFPMLLGAVEEMAAGETVVLDWSNVEIATASYLGATFVPLLRMAMQGQLDRYFVVAGLNKTCLEELKLVLELQNLVALTGEWKDGSIQDPQVIGRLEPVYAATLNAVQNAEAASAADLFKKDGGRARIGKTGWINRLSNLHRLRLVRKQRVGREYLFQSLSKERLHGR
ncbi:MAG TPA: hypothetical protein VMF66_03820 [Candidatus Acidoferrum sp.]|nr:hypothetical protein [Candidatus Acidoferrum sp.]